MTDTRTIGRYVHPVRQTRDIPAAGSLIYSNTSPPDSGLPPLFFVRPVTGGVQMLPMDAAKGGAGLRRAMGASPFDLSFGNFLRQIPHELRDEKYDRVIAYKSAVWAFVCINRRASAVAAVPRRMRDRQTDKPVYEHPLLTAIDNAYAHFEQRLFSVYEKSLCIHGEAYIEPVSNGWVYNALHLLNPLGIDLVISGGALRGYRYMGSSGGGVTFNLDELFMDRLDDPASDIRGDSLIGAALDAINVSRDMRLYTQGFFRSDGMPAGIVTARQGFAPTQLEAKAFIDTWKEQSEEKGVSGKYDIRFVPGAFEFQRLQREPVPEDIKLSEQAQEEICAVFQVPRAIAGAIVDANYQTSEQRLDWHENVIATLLTARAEFVNTHVKPLFDPQGRYEFEFDLDSVLDRLGRRNRYHDVVAKRLNGGEITVNESRQAMGDEPLPGGDYLMIPNSVTPVPVAKLGQVETTIQPAPVDAAIQQTVQTAFTSALSAMPKPAAPVLRAKGEGVPGATALLKPDAASVARIQAVADALREVLGEDGIQWTPTDQYHVTLVSASLISDEALHEAAHNALPFRAFETNALPVSTFDNDTVAIVIPLDAGQEVREYQRDLYHMGFADSGATLSGYSDPDAWKPHITLAYAPEGTTLPGGMTGMDSFAVTFDRMQITRSAYEVIHERAADTETAESELAKWQRKVKRAVKARGIKAGDVPFTSRLIREDIAHALRAVLADALDDAAVQLAFARAWELVSYKAIQATRLRFEADFDDLIHQAMNKRIDRRAFSNRLRALIRNSGVNAYRDGLTDGGIEASGLDDDDLATVERLISEQTPYVTALGEVLFKGDGITPAQADAKASTWYNKSIEPFYRAGVGSADRNGLYEWVLGRTEEHCRDCKRLNGQKHRMKDWLTRNLAPKSDKLECKGFKCECKFVKTNGRATGRF